MAKETWTNRHAAAALMRRDPWRPAGLAAVLLFLPAFLMRQAPQAYALLSLLRSVLCMPLFFAVTARLQLSAFRGGFAPLADTVREKARQWRALLMLALAGMMVERTGAFVSSAAAQLLLLPQALVGWIPLFGPVISVAFSVLIALVTLFTGLFLSQIVYLAWLAQEGGGGSALQSLTTAWRFLKAHLRAVTGLYAGLTAVQGVLWLSLRGMAEATGLAPLLWPFLDALLMLLGVGYLAALYAGGMGTTVHDPHKTPLDLDRMKRANIREE